MEGEPVPRKARATFVRSKVMKIAGLMSGTSLDGLTIGLISVEEPSKYSTTVLKRVAREAKFLSGKTFPFPVKLRTDLSLLAETENRSSTSFLAKVNSSFGEFCAGCIRKYITAKDHIDLIGFHGQTVYHEPGQRTITFQLGDPSPICLAADCPVVSDFRTMDTAAGGQGAPLVPIIDYLRYNDTKRTRIVLNLGGIANFTLIPRNSRISDVRAFDVGPANILIDGAIRELYQSEKSHDEGGKIALRGKVSEALMDYIKMQDDFRFLPGPKSTGRERYSRPFLQTILDQANSLKLSKEDTIATISNYSLFMINFHIQQIMKDQKKPVDEIIVGGGGSKNNFLMKGIAEFDKSRAVSVHDSYGVPARYWESFSFAIMALLAYHRITGNVQRATGASRQVVLGRINYSAEHQIT
jgi:anhydro-N-acetylmuramic acid kinase